MTRNRSPSEAPGVGPAFPLPDPWLVRHGAVALRRAPGPLLDLACGPGQNALWAASLGLAVTGIDASSEAVDRAAAEASRRSLLAEFRQETLGTAVPAPPVGSAGWGGILVFHYLDRELLPALPRALLPGGVLAYKTHLAHRLRGASTRPRRSGFLLQPGELLRAFPALHILEYAEWARPGEAFAALLARRGHSR